MYTVFILTLIITSIESRACSEGTFTFFNGSRSTTQCHFQCRSPRTGNYEYIPYPSSEFNALDITIQDFADWNENISYAYSIGACNDVSDLTNWPPTSASNGCATPTQCICNSNSIGNEIYGEIDYLFSKRCVKCTCDSYTNSNAYTCGYITITTDPEEYEAFSCPQTVVCIDGADTYRAEESWFWSQNCSRFCYCGNDGKTYCGDDYIAIINHKITKVRDAFIERCNPGVLEVECLVSYFFETSMIRFLSTIVVYDTVCR